MLKSFASILLLVFFIIIQSCKSGGKENTDGVLAEVNGVKLIKKDLPEELIKKFGTNVNLGNIAFDEVIPLETLRLGLRGDTFNLFLQNE